MEPVTGSVVQDTSQFFSIHSLPPQKKHNKKTNKQTIIFLGRAENMFISGEAGQNSHNLLCVLMHKR